MDKFLIATNPLHPDEIFIVHTFRPLFTIRVIAYEPAFADLLEEGDGAVACEVPAMKYPVGESHRVLSKPAEKWTLIPILRGTGIEPFTKEATNLFRIVERASRWWRAYRTQNPAGHHVDPKAFGRPAQSGEDKGL